MPEFTLVIGTKNLSSWSLRAWLMLKHAGVPFDTVEIELDQPDTKDKILKFSPSGKVPLLKHHDLSIWDTLAIGEYLAEIFPHRHLWPADRNQRAMARSLSAEMHSGFQALRQHLPMNIKARVANHVIPADAAQDIERIIQIWQNFRALHHTQGKFLFGHFTIADVMFAPVATRFVTYQVNLPSIAEDYVNTIIEMPFMQEWNK